MLTPIKPLLTLNYDRQIGRPWKGEVISGASVTADFNLGQVQTYYELIVPSVAEGTGNNLTACANAIYTAAREANMSLSEYGHLDPVKFVFAACMLGLLFEECKRDVRCFNNYEFGNKTKGHVLSWAASRMSVVTLTNKLPNILVKMDMLANRINALYIPAITAFADWLPHRCYVYKDDEGDRYQLYLYRMRNIYYLETDPNNANIGQLIFKPIANSATLEDKLGIIEDLLNKYEADDDFVNFATEAVKAGLPRLMVNTLAKDSSGIIKFDPVEIKFDIDDICSIENAYFVTPMYDSYQMLWTNKPLSWDIRENTVTGKFEVGKCGLVPNVLPVLHPIAQLSGFKGCNGLGDTINNRPIFTRARVESEVGLFHLTKYMACVDSHPISNNNIMAAGFVESYISYLTALGTKQTISRDFDSRRIVTTLTCHSSVMLTSAEVSYDSPSVEYGVDGATIPFVGCYISNLTQFCEHYRGFKMTPYGYNTSVGGSDDASITGFTPIFKDFDYITAVSIENLNQFFSAHLWNSFTLLRSGGSGAKSGYHHKKGGKPQQSQDSK